MSYRKTKRLAEVVADFLKRQNYIPATIINAGVGQAPELGVWRKNFGDINIIGVDAKPWNEEQHSKFLTQDSYIQAILGSEEKPKAEYCEICHSTKCALRPWRKARHRKAGHIKEIRQTTIDVVARNAPSPFFLWMDIDGSEFEALNGAIETLKHTRYVLIELVRPESWPKSIYASGELDFAIRKFLSDQGFAIAFQSPIGWRSDWMYEMQPEIWKKYN